MASTKRTFHTTVYVPTWASEIVVRCQLIEAEQYAEAKRAGQAIADKAEGQAEASITLDKQRLEHQLFITGATDRKVLVDQYGEQAVATAENHILSRTRAVNNPGGYRRFIVTTNNKAVCSECEE